jgi:hypothetical protein
MYERRMAEQDGSMRDADSACEISIASDAPLLQSAHGYEVEREETRALQDHRYRWRNLTSQCRID